MTFVLTLFYISISLLSPAVLPDALQGIHILQVLGVLITLCSLSSVGKSKLLLHPGTYLVTGVLVAATLSILITGWLGGAIDVFMGFVPIVFTFYFIVIGCRTLNRIIILAYVLCAVALYISAQGIVAEYVGNFTSPYLLKEGIGGATLYRIRGLGVIADPNDLAQVLVAVLPLMWLRARKGRGLQRVFLTYVPSAALAVGIYFTHSRGGTLALIAVVLFGLKDAIGVIASSILTGLFTVGTLALNVSGGRGMNQDDGERISLWSQALTTFKQHPILGIGVDRFADYSDIHLTAHNSYVLCLAEMGIIGYFFWIGLIVSTWTGLSEIMRSAKVAVPVGSGTFDPVLGQFNLAEDGVSLDDASKVFALGRAHSFTSSAEVLLYRGMESRDPPVSSNSETLGEAESDREPLAHWAKIIRVALVGVLVAAFFLSRTYSIILYILLGIATSLQTISWAKDENHVSNQIPSLLRKIGYVMAGSMLFLYLFVRLHGVR